MLYHSDQGSTHASEGFQHILAANGIVCSMSRRGDCYDNAAMERWRSTQKSELGEHFDSYASEREELFDL